MRRIRYAVAASLDGYIAGPNGEADWITTDPAIDFNAFFKEFDTVLIGRRTFELMARAGNVQMPGMKTYVLSKTLQPSDYPGVTILGEQAEQHVASLRAESGKDIWLFGGGSLFRSLLDAGLVDTVELSIIPILLGGGIPLLPTPAKEAKLKLMDHKVYASGIVSLQYAVLPADPGALRTPQ